MTDVHLSYKADRPVVMTYASTVAIPTELLIDAGGWEDLPPEEQAAYIRSQEEASARYEAWRTSWRGRVARLRRWIAFHTPHVHLGPCATDDPYL